MFNIKIFICITAASVLRMMFNAFKNDTHISALHDYLTERMYHTARPTHLWESFEPYVSIPIGNGNTSIEEVMNTWTDQPGYPIVQASLIGSFVKLTQVILYIVLYAALPTFFHIYFSKILQLNLTCCRNDS